MKRRQDLNKRQSSTEDEALSKTSKNDEVEHIFAAMFVNALDNWWV
ncbi:MAG: hypothetical protein ABF743_01580 [Schleiferilactobacillus perolens]|nr:hypothetical protein [Schleiferilactobacillus harbinensis]MCI1913769.1 hypothetical protein [Schleiferilactobacillus harbinensis]